MATVSIGLPVYNGGASLRAALTSLTGQEYSQFELLISDNASTDDTHDIAQEFAARDPRIRCVRQQRNLGAAANFDFVFENTSADLFMWAACDDVRDPEWLTKAVAALHENPRAVLAASDIAMVDDINEYMTGRSHVSFHCLSDSISDTRPYVRFRAVIQPGPGAWSAVYGLIRRSALAQTRRLSRMPELQALGIAPDYVIVELCLQGPFAHVPGSMLVNQVRERGQEALTALLAGAVEHQVKPRSPLLWLCLDMFHLGGRYGLSARERVMLMLEFFRCCRHSGTLHHFLVERNLEATLATSERLGRARLKFERDVLLAPNRAHLLLQVRQLKAELALCRRDLKDRTRRLERHIARHGPE